MFICGCHAAPLPLPTNLHQHAWLLGRQHMHTFWRRCLAGLVSGAWGRQQAPLAWKGQRYCFLQVFGPSIDRTALVDEPGRLAPPTRVRLSYTGGLLKGRNNTTIGLWFNPHCAIWVIAKFTFYHFQPPCSIYVIGEEWIYVKVPNEQRAECIKKGWEPLL